MKYESKYYSHLIIVFTILSCLSLYAQTSKSRMKAVYLRCEYKVNPVIDITEPRLSWILESDINAQIQTAYRILVASSEVKLEAGEGDLWDSGKTEGRLSYQIKYSGKELHSREKCYWKVISWDKDGNPGSWSETASWEMGLLNKEEWKGKWVGYDLNDLGKGKQYHLPPAPYFRKEIKLGEKIKKARLYATALGLYEFYINGEKVGKDFLTPGWTDYNKRVYYQTYDVTNNLQSGENVLGSILSYGWYSGYVGYALLVGNPQVKNFYGEVPVLKAQLEVEYENGKREIISTDDSWKTNYGPIVESDILNGEKYDARKEFPGWSQTGFDDHAWKNAEVFNDTERKIESYPGVPVRVTQNLKSVSVTPRGNETYIFDMGQNYAGIIKLNAIGKSGDSLVIRYGEMLYPDGRMMTENLRKAKATDIYIFKGDPNGEEYTPRFTYHGFQYVEIKGLKTEPDENFLTGLVLGSDTPEAGTFECSDPMINKLYSNIVWTQRANFIDLPTDCPQRDERLGWTGDAQVYVSSAALNRDISAFYTKWLVDLNDAQMPGGAYPPYAPFPRLRSYDTYSPGWMEAGVICPYEIFKTYGDTEIIEKYWPNLVKFMKFLEEKSNGKFFFKEGSFEDIKPKGGFGDWLSIGKNTSPDMLATMYYAYCSQLMAEMAQAAGKSYEAKYYTELNTKVKEAFLKHYADDKGNLKCDEKSYGNGEGYNDGERGFSGNTQTAYANAIYMNILPANMINEAGEKLARLVEENNSYLTTGFLGVKQLLPALSETGHSTLAYKLLLNTDYPSLGYEVLNGATTIWERWNSFTKSEGFVSGMNSFSHYSFGSVYEWMFRNMAGINNVSVGYDNILIEPEIPKNDITYTKASLNTMNGRIVSEWELDGDKFLLSVTVPVNALAEIKVPAINSASVKLNNSDLSSLPHVTIGKFEKKCLSVKVGSGNYRFESKVEINK